MKKLLFFLFVIGVRISNAQTGILGGVVNGSWTIAGSPYNIQGSIQILNGDSLVIEPGVTVNFQGTYKFLVLGKLKAIGTITDTIIFTATNITAGWRGIRFINTPSNNDTSKIMYCKFSYGKATGANPDDKGGALYISNFSKVIVSHSSIKDCYADISGGGIHITSASPLIINNIIASNSVSTNNGGGAGIFMHSSNSVIYGNTIVFNSNGEGVVIDSGYPEITSNTISSHSGPGIRVTNGGNAFIGNNIISNNSASYGAGILIDFNGFSTIYKNTITNNNSQQRGGGIFTYGRGAIIDGNTINNNTSGAGGGGICISSPATTILHNLISNNVVTVSSSNQYGGGGIYCNGWGDSNINNNVIANNNAAFGGGVLCYASSSFFENNTLSNNSSTNGGALYCVGSSPIFNNCVLWGNTASISGSQLFLYDEGSDPNFYYSDVEGGTATFDLNSNFYTGNYVSNINTNPLYVSPSAGSGTSYNGVIADWSLQGVSPCINAGNPSGTYLATDIAGNPRIFNSIIDIGAYELQGYFGVADYRNQNEFSVYPNPTTGQFIIETNQSGKQTLQFLDIKGGLVLSQNINGTTTIDAAHLESGVYTLIIKGTSSKANQKLVIAK